MKMNVEVLKLAGKQIVELADKYVGGPNREMWLDPALYALKQLSLLWRLQAVACARRRDPVHGHHRARDEAHAAQVARARVGAKPVVRSRGH